MRARATDVSSYLMTYFSASRSQKFGRYYVGHIFFILNHPSKQSPRCSTSHVCVIVRNKRKKLTRRQPKKEKTKKGGINKYQKIKTKERISDKQKPQPSRPNWTTARPFCHCIHCPSVVTLSKVRDRDKGRDERF